MATGGSRPGSGRPAGARNKRTLAAEARARAAASKIEGALDQPFLGDAHALLIAIYKDPGQPMPLRIEAAGKAIRFEKPMLSTVELQSEETVKHIIVGQPLSPEDRDRDWLELHRTTN